MRIILITVLAVGLFGTAARAGDPVGTYSVSGSNPGGGGAYSGTATVEKTGGTYKVTWDVAGTHFEGTGLGDSRFLGVSYRTGDNTGLALYSPEGDDGWACGPTRAARKWARKNGPGADNHANGT
jgi:hypothetical protein